MAYKSKFSGGTVDDNIELVKDNNNYWDTKENSLGNPSVDDYVLKSKTNGIRYWAVGSALSSSDQQKLDYITVTNNINLDDIADLVYNSPIGTETYNYEEFISIQNQTDFTIFNKVFTKAGAFVNGIRKQESEFSISDDGTNTTISFIGGLIANDNVIIDFFINAIPDRETYNFIATANQTVFNISNNVFSKAGVYTYGIRNSETEYNITNNTNNTIITFISPLPENAWVLIDTKG